MTPAPLTTLAFLAFPRATSEATPESESESESDRRRGRRPGPWTVAAGEGRRRRWEGRSAALALMALGMAMALLLNLEPTDLAPRPARAAPVAARARMNGFVATRPGQDEATRP
jgi:hypothetical protein